MTETMEEIFFEILRSGIGTGAPVARKLSDREWDAIYKLAKRHCLLGIAYVGVQNHIGILMETGIEESEIIPKKVYYNWMGNTALIAENNEMMNGQCVALQSVFRENGFDACVLKGQGVARYYGELSPYRQCGDIDIWIWPKDDWTLGHKDRMKKVISFLTSKYKCETTCYHHIEFITSERIKVEVHYTPSWMFSPLHNRRLQKWFKAQAPTEMQNDFSTIEFNRFYVLLHIYRHLFFEGIGLRQIVDYFFVLKSKKITTEERLQTLQLFKSFGLVRFASAMMWILHEKLGLPTEYLLCEPDENEGRFLLSEILQAGNFGHYDKRINRNADGSLFSAFRLHVSRNFHFLTHYPSEVLWCPLWKVWHQLWLLKFKG